MAKNKGSGKKKNGKKSKVRRADGWLNLVIQRGSGDPIRHGLMLNGDSDYARDDWHKPLLKAAATQHNAWLAWDSLSDKKKKKASEPDKYLQIKVEGYCVASDPAERKKKNANW